MPSTEQIGSPPNPSVRGDGGASAPVEELSVADAVGVAKSLHRAGYVGQARKLLDRVLEAAPEYPDAWHFLGLMRYQLGERDAGFAAVEKALALAPDYADAHANFANMLIDRNRFDEAESHLQRALELDEKAVAARVALAILCKSKGKIAEAETLLRTALSLNPDDAAAHHNLGKVLMDQRRMAEGLEHFWKAITLDNALAGGTRQLIGRALCAQGKFDEAARMYRNWLKEEPDNPTAMHLLAACGGTEAPQRAADNYVRGTFDAFSESFDAKLEYLEYQAPKLVAASLARCLGSPAGNLDLLDAGCGTGLLAAHVASYCRHLVGVDLSSGMLEKARARGGYDSLHESELTAFIAQAPLAYDVIASADTLCYFGALDQVARVAHASLRPGGWCFFTVEHAQEPGAGYRLEVHGRYSHRRDYIEQVLRAAGFEVSITEDSLRMENGEPVRGLIVAARKGG